MIGIAIVSTPMRTINKPAPIRLRLRNCESLDALIPVMIMAGIVPIPNAIMTRPPFNALAVVAASSNTL